MKISIEGNIGSGKSSVLTRLCEELRVPIFLEPINEWGDWLGMFYEDPSRWGMSFNAKVLLSFNKWKDNNFFALYERSPLSNRYVFAELQYEQNKMTKLELDLFQELYEQLAWSPDVIIYIKTDPMVAMQRMNKRARECENKVTLEYLQEVHKKYEDLLNKREVIVVDGNKSANEVYEEVVAHIKNLRHQSK